jgi:hypothetical protein
MLDLDDVLTYFATERPDWWARVVPATPDEIATLESLHERPLPVVQRRWLSLCGREPGELFDGYAGADPRIARLLAHFQAGGWRPQPPYALFGRDPEGRARDLFLRERPGGLEPDLVAFAMPGGPGNLAFETRDRPSLLAPDLASFVFRAGFDNLIGKQYALLLRGRVRHAFADGPAAIDAALVEQGLRRELGSDLFTASYRAQEAAVQWLRNHEGEDLLVRIWADDESLARSLGAVIGQRVPWEPGFVFPSAGPFVVHVDR